MSTVALERQTVLVRLLLAKRRILAAIHIRFRAILSGNCKRDLVLNARYLEGEPFQPLLESRIFATVGLSDRTVAERQVECRASYELVE